MKKSRQSLQLILIILSLFSLFSFFPSLLERLLHAQSPVFMLPLQRIVYSFVPSVWMFLAVFLVPKDRPGRSLFLNILILQSLWMLLLQSNHWLRALFESENLYALILVYFPIFMGMLRLFAAWQTMTQLSASFLFWLCISIFFAFPSLVYFLWISNSIEIPIHLQGLSVFVDHLCWGILLLMVAWPTLPRKGDEKAAEAAATASREAHDRPIVSSATLHNPAAPQTTTGDQISAFDAFDKEHDHDHGVTAAMRAETARKQSSAFDAFDKEHDHDHGVTAAMRAETAVNDPQSLFSSTFLKDDEASFFEATPAGTHFGQASAMPEAGSIFDPPIDQNPLNQRPSNVFGKTNASEKPQSLNQEISDAFGFPSGSLDMPSVTPLSEDPFYQDSITFSNSADGKPPEGWE